MTFHALAITAFGCAVTPFALFCWNLYYFRRPPAVRGALPPVSILIPARNEEANLPTALEGALSTRGIEFEIVVLDDGSTDGTRSIVQQCSARDGRVRLESGVPLPAGWAGKAHAAHILSTLAHHDLFCFVDADVRLQPDAVARMASLLLKRDAALVSGFPQQETLTPMEWLLLPLIQFLLLGYLPLAGLRHTRLPGFGAGCGQFLMITREAYTATGGYAAIPGTMHDGIQLPKLLRKHKLFTDVADLTDLAKCRMYRNAAEAWNGLMKNATEGLAAPARILPFTLLLLAGQVLPWVLPFAALASRQALSGRDLRLVLAAFMASLLMRVLALLRFRQSVISVAFHPISFLLLLTLQWCALVRKLRGTKVVWKEREFSVG